MRLIIRRKHKQILIFTIDICLLYFGLFLALLLRTGSVPSAAAWFSHLKSFSFAFIGWALVFYTAGLYTLEVVYDLRLLSNRLAIAIFVSTLGTGVMFYLTRDPSIAPKVVLLVFSVVSAVLIFIWRLLFAHVSGRYFPRVGVAMIGASPAALEILREPGAMARLGFEAKILFDEEATVSSEFPASRNLQDLSALMGTGLVELVVIGDEQRLGRETKRVLFSLLERRIRFLSLPEFYETVFRRVPLGTIDETWFLENIDLRSKRLYLLIKRIFDLFISFTILVLTLPLWPLIAVAVKYGSPGPVFFKQVRLGRRSRPFSMIKFRTMHVEGNNHKPTLKGDPRITRFGGFLRATRLDELPQMFNILAGEMSFVGPRPERPELAVELEREIPYYRQRLLVKPGITGWDQVSGEYHSPSVEDTYKKLQFDLYYVKNMGLDLDFSIFFKTILTVLQRAGR